MTRATPLDPDDYQSFSWDPTSPMRYWPDAFAFQTPSGNISCTWQDSGDSRVVCSLKTRYTAPPARPASCEEYMAWAIDHVVLSAQGAADGVCTGGVQVPQRSRVLPYGSALVSGDYGCSSEESGVTCVHLPSGRGFLVSRELFAPS